MKGKMKFSLGSIQELLVRNVEKIVFAGVILVLVLFVHRAVSREVYEKSPDELVQVADAADNRINTSEARSPVVVKLYGGIVSNEKPISVVGYERPRTLGIVFQNRGPRTMAPHYPVEDLRVASGHGGLGSGGMGGYGYGGEEMSGGPTGGPTAGTPQRRGQRWVVLTGLINFEKQQEAYDQAFKKSVFPDPSKDTPRYFAFKVERAEIEHPHRPGVPKWERIVARASLRLLGRGMAGGDQGEYMGSASSSSDIHSFQVVRTTRAGQYTIPLTSPLPPVANYRWGPEIAHYPLIPLARDLPPIERTVVKDDLTNPLDLDSPIPGAGRFGGPGRSPGGYGGYGGDEEDMAGYGDSSAYGGYGYGTANGAVQLTEEQQKYRLFRFYDFDVHPGKHYMYRVSLLLVNPNYQVPDEYLMSKELGEKWYVESEVSKASDVVTVVRDSEVLAGVITPSRTREPKAKVGLLHFDVETGKETFAEFEVARGQLLNYAEYEVPTTKSPTGGGGYMAGYEEDMEDMMDPGGRGRRPTAAKTDEEPEKVDLMAEMVVLDMDGGDKFAGRKGDMTIPGRILLLDAVGRLLVKDELDDEELYAKHKPAEKKDTPIMDDMMEGYDEDMEEMMYGGEGGRRGGRRGRRGYEDE